MTSAGRRLAVVLDDWALAALPGIDRDLALAGAVVVRCYERLPSPAVLRRLPECHGVAVLGGRDLASLRDRLETATATLAAPVVAALPPGQPPLAELRGPGVVDLLPAGTPRAAERVALMAWVPIVTGGARRAPHGAAPRPVRQGRPGPQHATAEPGSPSRSALGEPSAGEGLGPSPPAAGPLLDSFTPGALGVAPSQVVAIASSTGGVWVVAALLQALRHRDRAAVLLAQHMDAEFVAFFAAWLGSVTPWPAVVVEDSAPLEAGRLYLAAGGRDLVAEPARVVALPASSRYVPSADRLLGSAGRALGPRALGLVLSGMGADGAEGLAEVGRRGGRAVCQAPSSAVVPSMPEAALRRWPGAEVVPPEALAAVVARGA